MTREEFGFAAELLVRKPETSNEEYEQTLDVAIRINAKYVVALYLEQIRNFHIMAPPHPEAEQ